VRVRNLVFDIRKQRRVRVFENKVLRRIFGPKRAELLGGWRKLGSEKLHNMYSSPNIMRIIKEDEMGRACSTYWRDEECMEGFG
jgi:hypothetical protein